MPALSEALLEFAGVGEFGDYKIEYWQLAQPWASVDCGHRLFTLCE